MYTSPLTVSSTNDQMEAHKHNRYKSANYISAIVMLELKIEWLCRR